MVKKYYTVQELKELFNSQEWKEKHKNNVRKYFH